jgi:hypothetical protein
MDRPSRSSCTTNLFAIKYALRSFDRSARPSAYRSAASSASLGRSSPIRCQMRRAQAHPNRRNFRSSAGPLISFSVSCGIPEVRQANKSLFIASGLVELFHSCSFTRPPSPGRIAELKARPNSMIRMTPRISRTESGQSVAITASYLYNLVRLHALIGGLEVWGRARKDRLKPGLQRKPTPNPTLDKALDGIRTQSIAMTTIGAGSPSTTSCRCRCSWHSPGSR